MEFFLFRKKKAKKKINGGIISKIDYRGIDESISEHLRRISQTLIKDLKYTFKMCRKNEFTHHAAAISFYLIFTFFPLMILCYNIATLFVANNHLLNNIMVNFLETAIPTIAPWITESVIDLMNTGSYTSFIGIIILLWSIYELFKALSHMFEIISFRKGDRDIFGSNVISILCMFALIISINASMVIQSVNTWWIKHLGIMGIAVSFIVALTFIFKYMPTQTIKTLNAFFGGIIFIILFLLGRMIYELYIQIDSNDLKRMYGVFSTIIFVLIWSYVMSVAFIFSAQFAIIKEEKQRRRD